ncbi:MULTISPECIES: hypothetical protein [unclassified Streptomyces]|uniref:Uncharacterized protein n=1 Tax=Streptomyces sp. NBC_00060 TaxID=2975636 RepID=A0AAU2HB43_9ACTN
MDRARKRLTRRAALTAAVAGAGSVAVSVPASGAATARGRGPGSTARTDLARVRSVTADSLHVDFPQAGTRTRSLMAPDAPASRETVPMAGFPQGVVPRPGDRVMVTDWWDGRETAAIPVVSWVTGVPRPLRDGGYRVGGRRAAPSPLLERASRTGTRTAVCLLDTELATAQVMAVRPPSR